MSAPNTKLPCKPGARACRRPAVVRAAAGVAVALCLHGAAAAQGFTPARQQEQPSQPQAVGSDLPAMACHPDPDLVCLCRHGTGGAPTGFPALQAEIAVRFPDPAPSDVMQQRTEWRRQCGITSDEDTWP